MILLRAGSVIPELAVMIASLAIFTPPILDDVPAFEDLYFSE